MYGASARIDHLPGHAVLVFKPPVPLAEGVRVKGHKDLPARRQLFPYRIDFLVRAALDVEGYGRIELEQGPRADRHERLPREFEGHEVAVARRRARERVTLLILEPGNKETYNSAASRASLSNHRCGVIFCILF